MEAKELRIGNYIKMYFVEYDYNKECQISIGDFIGIKNGIIKIKPIPLTEQWLKDLGFRENNKKFFRDHPYFIGYKDWRPEGFWMLRDPEVPIRLIKYVHQLQNLYFALTEKELTK